MSFDRSLCEFKILSLNNNGSLFSKPVKQYAGIDKENEIKLLQIPTTLWLCTYKFLDIHSLVGLIITCKTFGIIANDQSIRKKLYDAHENKKRLSRLSGLFSMDEPKQQASPQKFLGYSVPSPERLTQIQLTPPIYNDTPGSGFVMR